MMSFRQYIAEKTELVLEHIYINLPSSRQQTDYTCGAVALRSIAKYYGKDLDNEAAFKTLCKSGKTKGAHPEDIAKAAIQLGFNATVKKNMTINQLTTYIFRKIPVICAIQAWSNHKDPQKAKEGYNKLRDGHYVVAIGFDKNHIYFEDPSIKGKRPYLTKKEFYDRWIDKEAYVKDPLCVRLGIVIKGPQEVKRPQFITKTQRLP